ncbi:MAG: DUF4493 domain-containing protein [Rikenellaceae bacterium]
MKRYLYIYAIAVAAILAAVGCSKSDDSWSGVGYGSITILSSVEVVTSTSDVGESGFEIPSSLIPSVDDMELRIVGTYQDSSDRSEQSYDETFENTTEFNSSASILWSGEYEATLSCGGDPTQESETNACFASSTTPFTIVKGEYNTQLSLSAKLINSIIRVKADDWFMSYFSAATFTITTQSGGKFVFDPFSADNDDRIIFVEPGTALTLQGVATRVSNGGTVTFNETYIGTTAASQMTTFLLEGSDIGGAKVDVTINNTIIQSDEQSVDLNPII